MGWNVKIIDHVQVNTLISFWNMKVSHFGGRWGLSFNLNDIILMDLEIPTL